MLTEIIDLVRGYEGLRRKRAIKPILAELSSVEDMGRTVLGFGEDCAVIDFCGRRLLLAAESIWSRLLQDPEWAGYCSILANVNDVYAMGGRPLAVVNSLSFADESEGTLLARGMRRGSEKFRVPIVGGHVQPDCASPSIHVCILGYAENPISSFGCREGDEIIIAVDTEGDMRRPFLNFDSTSEKSSDEVLFRLEALIEIADGKLATAAKDISNPGVLGSVAMMLETSKAGAMIDIGSIPRPENVSLNDWLLTYPGCGFILSARRENSQDVLSILRRRKLSASLVGKVTSERKMRVSLNDESAILFDLEREIITGAGSTSGRGAIDE